MYIGSTDARGLMHCMWEIIDNSVDEALAGVCDHIDVSLMADGSVEVRDNGRGIPVDMEPRTGLSGVEVVFTKLHAGGKFGGGSYTASGGLHGVGASVVNALSARLDVEVDRGMKTHAMSFRRGEPGVFHDVKGLKTPDASLTAYVDICREAGIGCLQALDVVEDAWFAPAKTHRMGLHPAVNLDVQTGGQRVDDRGAHAVQTTGGGVGATTELATGVQLGEDHLDTRQTGTRLHVNGNAPPVVADLDRPVSHQRHIDVVTHPRQGLINGVVDDLPHTVHEATSVGRPDIHRRTLADRLEAFQDLQVARHVVG